jgi:chromosome segregation ATPase
VEGQSSERAKTIELQEKEIHALRSKVVENEELVSRAMNMEGFMDQQIALLRQEHEEAVRQLKLLHDKELEAEVDRHREELETALTRAQLCLLSPSLPHNNNNGNPNQVTAEEMTNLTIERDELIQQRDNLQQQVLLVTRELEESAKALVAFDERLSKKDEKIARLKDETKSLYLSLNNITSSNQALKEKTKSMKRRMSHEPYSETRGDSLPPSAISKPLFANPLLDKYWGMFYLLAFGVVLVLHHILSSFFVHGDTV